MSTVKPMHDDTALKARLQNPASKEAAFGDVVAEYQERLYYHIRRMLGSHDEADDVLQNTFIRAWRAIDKFRGDSKLHTWLYRIATNEALTAIEKRKRRSFQDLEQISNTSSFSSSQDGSNGDDIQQRLQNAIETLPERQKAVFSMRYFDEMPYQEISDILGVTVGSLKASYHHAVKKIEEQLTNEK
ncbi:MAG: RNA polymerase sigma factor [Bacteroidia bacterium]